MRLRCRLGIHVYDRLPDSIYDECVWCKQQFYTGSDHGALNVTKERRRIAEHARSVAEQRLTARGTAHDPADHRP